MEEQEQKSKTKKPVYKKWWFWLIIGIVTLAIVVGAIVGTGDNSIDNSTDSNKQTDNDTIIRTYSVGETFSYDSLEIKVTKSVVSDVSDIYYGQGNCNDNEKFIVVVAIITNASSNSVKLKKSGQNVYATGLYYLNDEERISYSTRSFFYNDHFIDHYDSIIPLGSIEVYFSFRIPKSISNGNFVFKFSENKKATKDIVEVNL